jgi:hypothetical protein
MCPSLIVFALVVVLLIVLMCNQQTGSEHFDTYYNHDMGVYDLDPKYFKTPKEANRWAEYNWSLRDNLGRNVYDLMYEDTVLRNNYIPQDVGYAERELAHPGMKDSYVNMEGQNLNPQYNTLGTYSYKDMASADPGIFYNGQVVSLSQKNY